MASNMHHEGAIPLFPALPNEPPEGFSAQKVTTGTSFKTVSDDSGIPRKQHTSKEQFLRYMSIGFKLDIVNVPSRNHYNIPPPDPNKKHTLVDQVAAVYVSLVNSSTVANLITKCGIEVNVGDTAKVLHRPHPSHSQLCAIRAPLGKEKKLKGATGKGRGHYDRHIGVKNNICPKD
ncbi:hypothetical protein JCM11641_000314 [Rhodosporidiobolus odoratus]